MLIYDSGILGKNSFVSHPCRMLEYGEYKGHLYGTSVDAVQAVLNDGKVCVMDLEPQVGL